MGKTIKVKNKNEYNNPPFRGIAPVSGFIYLSMVINRRLLLKQHIIHDQT